MSNRKLLKQRAKVALKKSYSKALFVGIILILTGGGEGLIDIVNGAISMKYVAFYNQGYTSFDDIINAVCDVIVKDVAPNFLFLTSVLLIASVVLIAVRLFIGYQAEVGGKRFFIGASGGSINLDALVYGFNDARYWGIVKAMMLRDVQLFFWTLLLGIPGIVKWYGYFMVSYILADNPGIDPKRAIEISSDTTYGEKRRLFLLDLSLVGWRILGVSAMLVGSVFVEPYILAVKTEAYLALRKKALDVGLCSYGELLLEKPS